MELTALQIQYIIDDVKAKGIAMDELAESLVDHICCTIENSTETDFTTAYLKAISSFGDNGLKNIQQETIILLNFKKQVTMKKAMYVLCYISVFLSTTGLLFKIQHWQGAAVMLVLGVALFNFGFLPMYFHDRYKKLTT
jgi:hypothetical protein